ncbi:MAG: hypothetical protein AAFQ82_25450, partial [Myxococcota bacterium]
ASVGLNTFFFFGSTALFAPRARWRPAVIGTVALTLPLVWALELAGFNASFYDGPWPSFYELFQVTLIVLCILWVTFSIGMEYLSLRKLARFGLALPSDATRFLMWFVATSLWLVLHLCLVLGVYGVLDLRSSQVLMAGPAIVSGLLIYWSFFPPLRFIDSSRTVD